MDGADMQSPMLDRLRLCISSARGSPSIIPWVVADCLGGQPFSGLLTLPAPAPMRSCAPTPLFINCHHYRSSPTSARTLAWTCTAVRLLKDEFRKDFMVLHRVSCQYLTTHVERRWAIPSVLRSSSFGTAEPAAAALQWL